MQLRLRCVCSLPRWGVVGRRIIGRKVFAYPGLGQATIDAGLRGDLPLLMGIVLFSTVLVFIGNSLSTRVCPYVEPCSGTT